MRKLTQTLLALAAGTALALPASAAIVNPIVDLGSGFAKEGNRVAGNHVSISGDVLTIVGRVVDFNMPFGDLDPNDPAKEYTYIYTGLVSQGTTVSGGGAFLFYDTPYAGGSLRIYCDPAMNADFADLTTFTDGDCILEASLSSFVISTKSFNCAGTQNTNLQFTGGSLFNRVSVGGTGFTGIATGLFSVCPSFVDDPREAQGYFGLSDTKLDADEPVPTQRKTWGEIKKGN